MKVLDCIPLSLKPECVNVIEPLYGVLDGSVVLLKGPLCHVVQGLLLSPGIGHVVFPCSLKLADDHFEIAVRLAKGRETDTTPTQGSHSHSQTTMSQVVSLAHQPLIDWFANFCQLLTLTKVFRQATG